MQIYNLATNEWKNLTNALCTRASIDRESGVMFQGLLYVIFLEVLGNPNSLWRYNLMDDAWKRLDVPIQSDLRDPKLVLSANLLLRI
jgi:hypothetical protein